MATVAEAGLYFYDSLITLAMLSSSDQAPGDESLGDALLGDALLGDALLGDALLGDASQGDKSQGQAIEPKPGLQTVEVNQEQLQAWAKSAPMNYLHKWQLVAAEKCRVLGDRLGAIDYYDQAIVGAKTHGYLQEEALANELAARFYLDWSKEKAALGYLQDAYYGYARWGAKIKTDQLENAYPQLLAPILQKITLEPDSPLTNSPNPGSNSSSSSLTGTNVMGTSGRRNSMPTLRTVTTPTAFLDLATVLKASQALSQEIKLDTLFSKLMQIAGENAGADRGVLILQRPEGWEVVAQWSNDTCDLGVMALDQVNTIPHTIINTVRRSQQAILLKDLAQDNTFVADPYFLHQAPHQAPQSLLCCPILNQGKLLGLLYLENTLSKGAFTADRLEILTLLMAQVAISLENAQLYHRLANYSHDLETQVEQRTQELQANNAKLQETLQQLKRRQAQLIQAEKMSSLGQMVAGVAHEINNPINFIGTNVAHARRYCQDLLELVHLYQWESPQPSSTIQAKIEDMDLPFLADDLTKLLDSMERGSDRIHQIILGLRNFSRLDEAERKSVDIHEGIDSTLLMLHHRLHSEGIEVIKDYGSLPLVQCYGSQLNQVFFNIFANAIDVLSPDLSPDVSPDVSSPERLSQLSPNLRTKPDFNSQIHITTEQRNGQADGQIVVITIADNGPGMTAETRQRIFDPFFTTKPVGKGTGLGLSICYQVITELHRGQLHCQSQPGKGTSFIIEIPKDEAK
jgi:signal transduction histidine kinase